MSAVSQLAVVASIVVACRVLGVSRASWYRWRQPRPLHRRRRSPARALVPLERQQVLETLNSPRFVDHSPAEVYATLLDEGAYESSPFLVEILHGSRLVTQPSSSVSSMSSPRSSVLA